MFAGRLHLRWWHWLLLMASVLLLVIVAVVLALRLSGERRYVAVVEALQATGKPTGITALIANRTPPDDVLQERWRRWAKSAPAYPDPAFSSSTWHDFVTGHGALTDAMRKPLDDVRGAMQPARDLLVEDRLCLGFAGHLHELAQVTDSFYPLLISMTSPGVEETFAIRPLATWLAHEVAVASDPRPALTDLDHLQQHLLRPHSLLDITALEQVAEHRDQAYLWLALQGRVPDEQCRSWLAEPPETQVCLAKAFDGERAVFNDLLANSFRRMSWTAAAFAPDPARLGTGEPWTPLQVFNGTWMWSTGTYDCATIAEVEAHISARLRRERLDPISATANARLQFFIARIGLSGLLWTTSSCARSNARHRVDRLAVRLLRDVPQLGLPRDEAELTARHGTHALAAVDDLLALRYERLADDRFRLSIDPGTPVPDFVDAPLIRTWSTAFGSPATSSPLRRHHGGLEIQLPAALSRP